MKSSKCLYSVLFCAFAFVSSQAFPPPAHSQSIDPDIKLNQLGYKPSALKVAIVPALGGDDEFQVRDADTGKVVYNGRLSPPKRWRYSGETVRQADFSELQLYGKFFVSVGGGSDDGRSDSQNSDEEKSGSLYQQQSYPFEISKEPLDLLHKASIKAFYYNRSAMAIDAKTGGDHARKAGHFDTDVKVHKSAATKSRPEGTSLSLPKGWYDAGDYGKYSVNSGISTYTLLAAYQHHTALYKTLDLQILESDNQVPDLIDEIKLDETKKTTKKIKPIILL